MKGRGGEVMAVAILFLILTWFTVSLRVYARGYMFKNFGKDDWAMVITQIIFTPYLAFQMVAAVHGTGQHRWELSDYDAEIALLFWYLCELLYVLGNCTLKIALGIFYLRIAVQRWHIWAIKLLMVGTVLFGFTYLFLVMFQCIPVDEFWHNHPASDKCLQKGPTTGITYALGGLNAFSDYALGILPFFIVWGLQMDFRTKVMVAGILAFAAVGSTATVVRMKYIHTLTNGPDFLYATTDVAIWSTVEPGIGITAGSLATLRPLLHHTLWRMGLASAPNSEQAPTPYFNSRYAKQRDRRGYRQSLGISDLVPTEASYFTTTTITGARAANIELEGIDQKVVVKEESSLLNGQIKQEVIVEQTFEGPSITVERPSESRSRASRTSESRLFDGYLREDIPRGLDAPPRVELRNSFRNSFTRGSIFSKRSYHGK
ncbi:hypothetical protein BS50DRAFT_187296 [Corynespora cassiicola Philippines]|uniref:Rhodopsin domain-containing protein n=1 Tax=Corynespora cassiicola Philippines TaxID=1448308 RepID=A0A2T2P785_CORCC|nr:hypothetical protein BS50DRAFT_187296 [Corynespora cassiicola Philippines]